MNFIKSIILIILSTILLFACFTSDALDTKLLINCGLPMSSTSESTDNRVWQSDDNNTFAPPNINTVSTVVKGTDSTLHPPYQVARLFRSPVTYTFSFSSGPKFLRLYFSPTISYNNTPSYQFSISLLANNFTLLQNFNPFLNSPQQNFIYEFHITLQKSEKNLNLTFSGATDSGSSYGYINGIEIESVPDDLYINASNPDYYYVTYPGSQTEYLLDTDSRAFQTSFRINIGGQFVDPRNDTGGMMRAWHADDDSFIFGGFFGYKNVPDPVTARNLKVNYTKKTPAYVAPKPVYETRRIMGYSGAEFNLAHNLTWRFEVDPGFDYMVRLHLREMDLAVTGPGKRLMRVYIGGLLAGPDVDIWAESGGFGIPMYKDYVITVAGNGNGDGDGGSNASKVPLMLALHPVPIPNGYVDVTLNGLEILKLSLLDGNLAVPNPPYAGIAPQISSNKRGKHKTLIITTTGGVIGGLLLVSVIVLALYRRRVQYKKLIKSTASSSNGQWVPTLVASQSSVGTTNGTNTSRVSLPSDLCRRFSLGQVRVATSDFDENLIIGVGGFGKVYKGFIDDGAATVAIKRLNPSSKQGAHEFMTEIEMLSRLRHVHLVSLIGYCDEQGEMILVYEYMPRGTLRDHLNYKDTGKDNNEVLSWKQRLSICLGSARGLDYLHTGAKQQIIHRDVKSTNILLDDKWTAKVSDFGLSKVGPANDTGVSHVSTAVKGSIGYLDPEYYRRQQLTEKSDVYSFGVVLFEVLCGRSAVNLSLPKEQANLAKWGRTCYKNDTLHTIVDPNLTGQIAPECLRKFGEIAEMCVRNYGDERPSMRDIVWSLEFALTLQKTAETNIDNGSPMVDVSGDTRVVSGGGNVSQSSGAGVDTQGFGSNSGSTTTTNTSTTTNYDMDMKSASVFSEILDPRAR